MKKHKRNRFESEVHLGLLVIIFILLLLNFTSNFIIYRARESKRNAVTAELNSASLAVTRAVQNVIPPCLNESQKHDIMLQHGLSGLVVIPSKPPDSSAESKKRWFSSLVRSLPPGQIPDIARKLLSSDYQELTRGDHNEYFYVYPIPSGAGKSLVILSKNVPQLAYHDDSGRLLLFIGIVSILAIGGVYLLLSRFIFSPFRIIKKQAMDAGRTVDKGSDDVEAMVEDYRNIIEELKEKEAQLLRLNKAIQRKADSLEQFNQYLLTSMNSGIVTLDKEGRILSVNRAAGDILGVVPADYEGQSCRQLLRPNSQLTEVVNLALSEGKVIGYQELDFTTSDGQRCTLGTSVSLICDHAQHPIGASIFFNDLTELKRLRAELETKNRLAALGEMSGGLAHQLRNSMGAITGYCNLLKKRLKKSGIEIGSIAALIQEAVETEKLVERFLQFARPLAFVPQQVSVKGLIRQVIEALQARPDFRQAEFVVRQLDDITMDMDPLLIKQALTNIIENAVNAYENRQGLVEIRVSPDAKIVNIEVEDFGCGIAAEDFDKIFTPFFSSRPSGTGLGLPLARKIIDLHGGFLSLISQVGKGTAFRITLPLRKQLESRPVAHPTGLSHK